IGIRHQSLQGHAARSQCAREAVAHRGAGLPGRVRAGDAEVRPMIKINLLPHREEKRKQRKKEFAALMVLSAVVGALIVLLGGGYFASKLSNQEQRNNFIKTENAKLDVQIKEVATLKQEIEALKARQQAVEDLQSDRNQPVYLMD